MTQRNRKEISLMIYSALLFVANILDLFLATSFQPCDENKTNQLDRQTTTLIMPAFCIYFAEASYEQKYSGTKNVS